MIKNGLAEGMVTRKLCVEVLDLVLTSFQTSFFSAPTASKVPITDMLLLSTSFFSYPLPRSHRQGGFEQKMFPSTSYSFLFQIKAAAQLVVVSRFIGGHVSTCQACCVFDWLKIETLKRQRISDSNPGAMTIRVGLLLLLATWQVLVDGRSDVKSTTKGPG